MNDLSIDATTTTPRVHFAWESGRLLIEGESYPENSFELYQPLLSWLEQRLDALDGPVTLEIHLTYMNTSSIKALMDMLEILEDAHRAGRTVAVVWRYDEENDRALEMAEEFKEDVTLPFDIVAVTTGA